MILDRILESPEVRGKVEKAGLLPTDIEFIKALIKGKVLTELRAIATFTLVTTSGKRRTETV